MPTTTLTPEQRRLRGRIGALALHASGGTSTAAGTRAFLDRFEHEVRDAATARGEELTPEETNRRVRLARRAYFARLALASSRARSKRKAATPADCVAAVPEVRHGPAIPTPTLADALAAGSQHGRAA